MTLSGCGSHDINIGLFVLRSGSFEFVHDPEGLLDVLWVTKFVSEEAMDDLVDALGRFPIQQDVCALDYILLLLAFPRSLDILHP